MKGQTQTKKKSSKQGRNSAWCQRYTAQARRLRNKVRRVRKHCRAHPNDAAARERLTWEDMRGIRGAVFARGVAVIQLKLATAPLGDDQQ